MMDWLAVATGLFGAVTIVAASSYAGRSIAQLHEKVRSGPNAPASSRRSQPLHFVSLFLPAEIRDEHLDEWRDHLRCAEENAESVLRTRFSILTRGVLPLILGRWSTRAKRLLIRR
jgi:hypothetical protein